MRGISGVKLGPGVLRTIVPIISVGLIALAGVVYALASNVWAALFSFIVGIGFLAYAVERAFRYAENNPIPALFGGAELLQLFRDQMAAKDKTIMVESDPVIGSSVPVSGAVGIKAVEKKENDGV